MAQPGVTALDLDVLRRRAQVVSLQETLQLSNIATFNKRSTGEKFLINPNKG
jgi:hypothetical protein